jgi:lysosomal acid lipase/cholesteryl ester hydrolase
MGYDVWLGNNRGNYYSRKHLNLLENDPKYWDFGPEEMGRKDLPAFINYILAKRDEPQLAAYIGLGMGNT